jgi:hypothetical protein
MESRKNKGKPREDSKGNVPKKGGKKRRWITGVLTFLSWDELYKKFVISMV